jgi:hypothetical protein
MSPLRVHVLELCELERLVVVVPSARVIARIVTGASEFLCVVQRGHVTLLVRVGNIVRAGDGYGGGQVGTGVSGYGEGVRGYVRGVRRGARFDGVAIGGCECVHVVVVVVFERPVLVRVVAFVFGLCQVIAVCLHFVVLFLL